MFYLIKEILKSFLSVHYKKLTNEKKSKNKKELIAEDDTCRSMYIYNFLQKDKHINTSDVTIPKVIIQFWHSLNEIPNDVLECIESWKPLKDRGFKFELFDDKSAQIFINTYLQKEHLISYLKCHHPAMRSDYFRLCYLYVFGGFYVDADELFYNKKVESFFLNNNIKVQPFCYSIKEEMMIGIDDFLHQPYDKTNIYYFNNNPIIAPPQHDLISIALERATDKLIRDENIFDIQSITGPGNLSASLIYYLLNGKSEVEFIDNWTYISKSVWTLDYRKDDRNWRLYNGNKEKWFKK